MFVERTTGHTRDDFRTSTEENIPHEISDRAKFLSDVTTMLWQVVPPVLLVFGTFGNVMTMVVMRGMRAAKSTACLSVYFTALAVSDQCVLLTSLLWFGVDLGFAWPTSFFRFHLLCWVPKFARCMSGVTSAWFLVAMTYQRVTSVVAPHRVHILCTVRRGKILVLVVVIVACALNLHFLFTWSYWSEERQCQYREKFMHVVEVFEWLDLVWASMIPFLLLASGNSVLVWQVIQSIRLAGKMRVKGDWQSAPGADSKVHSMTTTLVLTSTAFLVLTLPICIFDVCLQMTYTDLSDEDFVAMIKLGRTICLLLWISSSASNFYLYLLSGSRFRQETKRYLCCRDKAKDQHHESGSQLASLTKKW